MKRAIAVLGLLALGWFAFDWVRVVRFVATPFGSRTSKVVQIARGSSPAAICRALEAAQIVSDAALCKRAVERDRLAEHLEAGEYEFAGALTPSTVLNRIAHGEVRATKVTIPEGLRVNEVLDLLAATNLELSRERMGALLGDESFRKTVGIETPTSEGTLFPDTYFFTHGATADEVLRRMAGRMKSELDRLTKKPGSSLTQLQLLTLASIIEKETAVAEERPRISCVFHNRLRMGMPLQTDPTVLYAKWLLTGDASKDITRDDLQAQSPYNTYVNTGLPPGPIANPGAAALKAAAWPIDCTDLYFVSRNDGTHVFCQDLDCHAAAVRRFQKPVEPQSTRR